MINDEESLLRSVHQFVRTNLNAKILAINSEKNDGVLIDQIPTGYPDKYVFSGEMLDLPNGIFVNFSVSSDVAIVNNRNDKSSTTEIIVEVAFDNPKKADTYFKSLRYMRALYETLLDFETSTLEVGGLQITKAIPMIVTSQTRELVISGVMISVALG